MKLTRKKLKEKLHYDPLTGDFTRRFSVRGFKIGSIAGSIDYQGYRTIGINGQEYKAHRLAWFYITGRWPRNEIDHLDHIRDNNRWLNLRSATRLENIRNRSISIKNKSGVLGVHWSLKHNKWIARISVSNKRIYLGVFDDIDMAAKARKKADKKYGFHINHGC